MRSDFHVRQSNDGGWLVVRQTDIPLADFRRRSVAEAYGRALAHRAKVALIVHHSGDRIVRFSNGELTYASMI